MSDELLASKEEWITRVFIREDSFYMINLPETDDLNKHAEMNPGTLRVEDLEGNILWPEGTKQ